MKQTRSQILDGAKQAVTVDRAATHGEADTIEYEMENSSILAIAAGAGRKADVGKTRMDLLPPELLISVSDVLTFGAQKYEARNWEKGMEWGRVYAAAMRHLVAWWSGEDTDPETGLSHIAHAACCLAFLTAYEARGVGNDDRPKSSNSVDLNAVNDAIWSAKGAAA